MTSLPSTRWAATLATLSLLIVALAPSVQAAENVDDVTGNGFDLHSPDDYPTAPVNVSKWGLGLWVEGDTPPQGQDNFFVNNSTSWKFDGNMSAHFVGDFNGTGDDEGVFTIQDSFADSHHYFRVAWSSIDDSFRYSHNTFGGTGTYEASGSPITQGTHSIAFWRDCTPTQQRIVMYVDGSEYLNETFNNCPDPGASGEESFIVGKIPTSPTGFTGALREVRIWNETIARPVLMSISDPNDATYANALQGDEFAAWFFGDTIATPPPSGPTPTDFADGLDDAITNLGFRTSESQFFFSLALVGITTVATTASLRFMGSGRGKNWAISGTAMAIGGFSVLIFLIDFWIWLISAIAAAVVLQGPNSFVNNLSQIREDVKGTLDGDVPGPVEQTVDLESPVAEPPAPAPFQETELVDVGDVETVDVGEVEDVEV